MFDSGEISVGKFDEAESDQEKGFIVDDNGKVDHKEKNIRWAGLKCSSCKNCILLQGKSEGGKLVKPWSLEWVRCRDE